VIAPIDVRDILHRAGASRAICVEGSIDGTEGELARLDGPVRAEMILEAVLEGIYVAGRVSGRMALSCARCLTGFDRGFDLEFAELFSSLSEDTDYVVEPGEVLDVEQLIRDAIGVELPFSPLCRPDCLGLCPSCGEDLNRRACICERPRSTDPLRRIYAGS
jgi:uncharacterized protein